MEKPDQECPKCGRDAWEDAAGFGSLRPAWTCGYCGASAPDDNPAPLRANRR
jgi:hypothetical protein